MVRSALLLVAVWLLGCPGPATPPDSGTAGGGGVAGGTGGGATGGGTGGGGGLGGGSGGGSAGGGGTAVTVLLGGTVIGLTGQVTLKDELSQQTVDVTGNGPFVFPQPVTTGARYQVVVAAQPSTPLGQCTVSNGSGTVGAADVTSVAVRCERRFRIGGTATGVAPGVSLALNGEAPVTVATDGAFTLSPTLPGGAAFSVTVVNAPAGKDCTVANGTGQVAAADVSNVGVTCFVSYALGGTVAPGVAAGLVLRNTVDQQTVAISSAGPYQFGRRLASGASYDVVVDTQPSGQTCVVSNGAGVVTAAVTTVDVQCTPPLFLVRGTADATVGSGLIVEETVTRQTVTVSRSASFVFPGFRAVGDSYIVVVHTQPAGQTCSVVAGVGLVQASGVPEVQVSCSPPAYLVGGSVQGLTSGTVTLTLNGSSQRVLGNGDFTFPDLLLSGDAFTVTLDAMPADQVCGLSGATGTAGPSSETSVEVRCFAPDAELHFDANDATAFNGGSISDNDVVTAAVERSATARAATVSGSPAWLASGINGHGALSLSGSASLRFANDAELSATEFSWCLVMMKTQALGWQLAVIKDNPGAWSSGWGFVEQDNSTSPEGWGFWINSYSANASSSRDVRPGAIPTNQPYAICGRYDADTMRVVTSTGFAATESSDTYTPNTSALFIGGYAATDLRIGEFLFWSRALSDAELDTRLSELRGRWGF